MGSVCIISSSLLPACFHNAGNFSTQRHAAETDAAHFKLADVAARAPANTAAVAYANLEFGLLVRLGDFCEACHLLRSPWSAQRKTEALEELAAFFVVARGSGQSDVHALDFVHARVIDFRKNQLVFQPESVIAAAIESVGGQTAEVANTRQNHVAQPIDKLIHAVATQRDRAANRHTLANLEISYRFLGPRDDGLLPGDL